MQIANRLLSYANAIFTITHDKDTQIKYYKQISALDALNATNADFASFLSARFIDKNERKELAKEVLTGYGFDPTVIYWVWTIIDNNVYHNFHYIFLMCRDIYYTIFNIMRVKITSPSNLTETQMNKIKDFFETKLNKKIDIEWSIRPDLIGGLRIQLNNKTYNNTYKNKLIELKKELLSKKG